MIARAPAAATALLGFAVVAASACHRAPRACHANGDCASDEHCVFTPGLCGHGKWPGACRPRPRACAGERSPVCGCDGRAYDSDCAARAAGVDLAVNGGCRGPRDFIPCGARFCDAHTSYCEIVLSDVPEPPTDFTCKPLPATCLPASGAARGCGCFPSGTRCLSFCGHSETGGLPGFHLTCRL